jgi:hypothetical protein
MKMAKIEYRPIPSMPITTRRRSERTPEMEYQTPIILSK